LEFLVLALLSSAQAKRKRAKYEIQKRRKPEEARQLLEEARNQLEMAIELATRAGLRGDIPQLLSKLGKVYRELGRVITDLENPMAGSVFYRKSEETFKQARAFDELGTLERAGMLVDYAEMLVLWGNVEAAVTVLDEFAAEWVDRHHQPTIDEQLDLRDVATQFLRPLGKYERLWGQIALQLGHEEEALAHFARAFSCFQLFAPTAKEKETMVELLYDELRRLPVARKRELVGRMREQCCDPDAPEGMQAFVDSLGLLLGV
jgi:tetratricopeptide (TPR) repeat protein